MNASLTYELLDDGTYSVTGTEDDNISLLVIPASYEEKPVTRIGRYAFDGCKALLSVTMPSGIGVIGSGAFWGCTSLTSVTVPDGVTEIGQRAFEGCTSLTSFTIPDGVTEISYDAFRGCVSLASVTVPRSVSTIRDCAFRGCAALKAIRFSGKTEAANRLFTADRLPKGVSVLCEDGELTV